MLPSIASSPTRKITATAALNRPLPSALPKAPRKTFGQKMVEPMQLTAFDDGLPGFAAPLPGPPIPGNNQLPRGVNNEMADAMRHRQQMGIVDKMIGGVERYGKFSGGQTAFANSDIATSLPTANRKPFTPELAAKRDAAIKSLDTDPAAIASRQRKEQAFAPVADPALVMRGALPAVARRTDLTADQQNAFADRRNKRKADMEMSRQRQFSRAQFREATTGRGVMFQPDGSVDLPSTMSAQAFGQNPALGIEAMLKRDGNDVQRDKINADQQVSVAEFLLKDADAQREQGQADRQFNEDARQFDQKSGVEDLLARGKIEDGRRKNKLADRQGHVADLLAKSKQELEEKKAFEAWKQQEWERSPEPHRRKIDEKRSMPFSTYESPYFSPSIPTRP